MSCELSCNTHEKLFSVQCATQLPQDEIDKGTICLFANKSDSKELFAALYNLDEECLEKLNLELNV
ncbi:hypothetical protein Glove_40g98 [Diversispora epigaea]|uniref:Uncharacterized protein n=1 Tax=Diversispora epigaea TaxID=1348612 RepID=A0A397JGC4_9GLOM|nr:hypothetical protein Glove_40g98 [Diversispora epigaea]